MSSSKRFETSENLTRYFSEVNLVEERLTKEEEHELARRIRRGGIDGEHAFKRLSQANLKFVVQQANKFIGMGLPIDDLVQAGNMGLMEAAMKYTPDHDTKFLTYAKSWIRKRLNLALCEHGRTVRLPVNQEYRIYKERIKGEGPNLANVRIDVTVGDDNDAKIGDLILHADFNDPFKDQDTMRTLGILMKSINERERRVMELFYGLDGVEDRSTKDVAEILDMTPAEVNRTLKVARAKMRRKAGV